MPIAQRTRRRTQTPLNQGGGRPVPGTGVDPGLAGGPRGRDRRAAKLRSGRTAMGGGRAVPTAPPRRRTAGPAGLRPVQGRGASPRSTPTKGRSPVPIGGRSMAASGIHQARRGVAKASISAENRQRRQRTRAVRAAALTRRRYAK